MIKRPGARVLEARFLALGVGEIYHRSVFSSRPYHRRHMKIESGVFDAARSGSARGASEVQTMAP